MKENLNSKVWKIPFVQTGHVRQYLVYTTSTYTAHTLYCETLMEEKCLQCFSSDTGTCRINLIANCSFLTL